VFAFYCYRKVVTLLRMLIIIVPARDKVMQSNVFAIKFFDFLKARLLHN